MPRYETTIQVHVMVHAETEEKARELTAEMVMVELIEKHRERIDLRAFDYGVIDVEEVGWRD